jgi:DNA-binding NtrC family response regulator
MKEDMRWLVCVPGPSGWRRVVVQSRLEVGSNSTCDVRLARPGVALRHVRFQVVGQRLEAVDLAGEGRTTLAGKALSARPTALQSGDLLRVGQTPLLILCAQGDRVAVGALCSAAPKMIRAMQDLAVAATTSWPVLLMGESGVGKELAARSVHDLSSRRSGPWLAVNCGTLMGDTLAAELFGAQRGAYTGATENRKGAFERADGGTLFLDEIGELPADAQAMLLRVLEVGEVQVLGGPVRRVDVRVVCATHRDLQQHVDEGRFRLDLLHRLDVARVHLPPLRERPEDVVPLFAEFLDGAAVPVGGAALLQTQAWPGNVRQLRNVAKRVQLRAHFAPPRLEDLRVVLDDAAATKPQLRLLQGGRMDRKAERQRAVADLLAGEAQVCTAWRKSGLPRGTFFRYVKEVRMAAMGP